MENNTPSVNEPGKKEESIFSGEEFSLEGYDKHIRQARTAIFLAAGILALNLLVLAFTAPGGYEYLWIDLLIWGIFVAAFIVLGFWTKKKPYYAIVSALVLYSILIIVNAMLDPATIVKGIIFKVIVIVLLVKGLRDARDAQRMKEQIDNNK